METKTFTVPNIGCDGCVRTIKNELSELAGVTAVDAEVDTQKVTVSWGDPATWDGIQSLLEEIEYAPAN